MSVIKLLTYRCQDTIAVLRVLLAKAIKGELRGLALCYRTENGEEDTVFTGIYKAHPDTALGAGMRMSMAMTREHDARMGPP